MTAPYMPLFVADYLADTAHLSTVEHGAYLLLVMNYWQRSKPLPADDKKLARIARMSDAEWLSARDTLAELFIEEAGEWRHKRVEAELAVADEKTNKAKRAARLSVDARRASAEQTLSERSTDVELLGEARLGKEREDTASAASSSASAPEIDLIEAERRCAQAAGADKLGSFAPIAEMLHRQADLELDVLPVIRARPAAGGKVSSWKFYAPIIAEQMAKRAPPQAAQGPPPVFVPEGSPEWTAWAASSPKKLTPIQTKTGYGRYFPSRLPPSQIQRNEEAA
jgi:uncharacterized protein YdaU (DUF1376 family)